MRRLICTAAGAALLATAVWAQDPGDQERAMAKELSRVMETQAKLVTVRGAVMGPTVKGAPYSGDEITESTQVLADGTRIHNSNQATVYRDSEGRMRRDTPESITIFDPVEGVSYILNPKTQTGSKLQVSMTQNIRVSEPGTGGATLRMEPGPGGATFQYSVSAGEVHTTTADPQAMAALKEKMKTEDAAKAGKNVSVIVNNEGFGYSAGLSAGPIGAGPVGGPPPHFSGDFLPAMRRVEFSKGQTDSLGKQSIEGVMSEGSRMTRTIEAGSIGNDRPIQMVSERWYSPELQTTMMSKNSDPRSGDQTFHLTNVRRGEPGAYLFQPPAGYQVSDRK